MKEKIKNKNVFIILIILSIITIIAIGTYALFVWNSTENTELTMRIGDISEVLFEDGNDINISNIGPIFDYEKDGIENKFKITNLTTNEIIVDLKLNITSISDSLKEESFKYVLLSSNDDVTYEIVSEGNFLDASSNSTLDIKTRYYMLEDTYFKLIFYIDGNIENPIEMQNGSLIGYVTAEANMAYVLEGANTTNTNFLSTNIPRDNIESINFINTKDAPENSISDPIDVSLEDDGSVLLYYTDNDSNNLYEVSIGTKNGITIASSGYRLFAFLSNLKSINLENLDTSIVTHMGAMFAVSTNLTSLDLSNFDTSKVENMVTMFAATSHDDPMKLTEIKGLENFDTSKVTDMSYMFFRCYSLTELDVTSFNTGSVKDMNDMFAFCSSLETLDVSNFDTSNVTNMYQMFAFCSSLEAIDVSNFDTSSVTTMQNMFWGCSSLTELDISSFNTSLVTNMNAMFYECTNLKTIYISSNEKFKTSQVTNSNNMFYGCTSLVGGNGTTFDSSKRTATYARIDTDSTPGYFTLKSA